MERTRQGLIAAMIALPCLIVALTASTLGPAHGTDVRVRGTDHPVDMWRQGGDRWAYFSPSGFVPSAKLASKARKTLSPLGFVEDVAQRPWYRFVKGNEEVVVCDHSEFGKRLDAHLRPILVHSKPMNGPSGYGVVLVKNGPGSHASELVFRIKKTLLGW